MFGRFIGNVDARWDTVDECMTLIHQFKYVDPEGNVWVAPKGSRVDGASIPRFFWRIVGHPYRGKFRLASVVHDVYCENQKFDSVLVHRMFYFALRCNGCGWFRASVMWMAVRFFGPQFKARRV